MSYQITTNRDGDRNFYGNRGRRRGRGGNGNQSGGGPTPRSRLDAVDEEGDIDMGGGAGRQVHFNRYTPYGGGGGRRPYRGGPRGDRGGYRGNSSYQPPSTMSDRAGSSRNSLERLGLPLQRGGRRGSGNYNKDRHDERQRSVWYKIMIPYGREMGKDFILRSLTTECSVPFTPISFRLDGKMAIFNVEGWDTAEALMKVSRLVTAPSGFKMLVKATPSGPPMPQNLSPTILEQVKEVLNKRYNSELKTLNLTDFHNDPDFKAKKLYLPLNRQNVILSVIDLIGKTASEVVALDFTNNKLPNCDSISTLYTKTPKLKGLNLSKNYIRSEYDLDRIKDLNLQELILEGNPLCSQFKDKMSYVSAIRKRFPKVIKLDGLDLPPPIGFDVETHLELPKSKESFFVNDVVKTLVLRFIQEYFMVYDSNDRQQLLNAYHEQAFFSMFAVRKDNSRGPYLQEYLSESRNMIKVKGFERRSKLLKRGRLAVVSMLTTLPKTQHDPTSFCIDINHYSAQLLSFTVTGVFKEGDKSSPPVRSFTRVFVVVPVGDGLCIVNEQMCINNATVEQVQASFKSPTPTPSSSPSYPQPGPSGLTSSPVTGAPLVAVNSPSSLTVEQKKVMVEQFMKDSGMNSEWSAKCLEENAWNYEGAGQVFLELRKVGSIPMEAFTKS
ncbi:PREDICTED: nuclear RNA export factor 1-like [Priapulus caudatus]|uniref:Nuclear RNA export factor 1-like n=1 Tax=Priapulus caudatus TaxID=37621 RepID=A0ABM1EZK2_PRICU|nr:PREDICTED: nuclear RNA export factor 1-like [Priapulus caudatus]